MPVRINRKRLETIRQEMIIHKEKFEYHHIFAINNDTPLRKSYNNFPTSYVGLDCFNQDYDEAKEKFRTLFDECGTHCCVAGFASVQAFNEAFEDTDKIEEMIEDGAYHTAQKWLGLDDYQADFLFAPTHHEKENLVNRLNSLLYEQTESEHEFLCRMSSLTIGDYDEESVEEYYQDKTKLIEERRAKLERFKDRATVIRRLLDYANLDKVDYRDANSENREEMWKEAMNRIQWLLDVFSDID